MKKVLLLAAVILGTSAMVNAQEPAKAAPAKEVKTVKKNRKADKKAVAVKTETTKAEAAKPAAKK